MQNGKVIFYVEFFLHVNKADHQQIQDNTYIVSGDDSFATVCGLVKDYINTELKIESFQVYKIQRLGKCYGDIES
jgi:hypothetical protein